ARRDRRMRRKNISRRGGLERGVKVEILPGDAAPDQLERDESRVAFIEVMHAGLDAHGLQRMDAADAQDYLLLDAPLVIATVKLGGDFPVMRGIFRHVGIE